MEENNRISEVVFGFVENMDALNESSPLVIHVVNSVAVGLSKAHSEYLEKYGEIKEQDDEKKVYSVPVEKQGRTNKLSIQSANLRASAKLIPRNFLVSYVSEFDCFLGALLKVIYTKKPELLNDSSKQITYTELLAYESLEDAKEQILEKEIESVLRKSHSEHFSVLENKFGIKLRKGLDIWSDFIEMTERRNLFVHSNGVVSSQYLKVCEQNGVEVKDISVGDKLQVDSEYLKNSYRVIFEISVKLAHVLWRKLFPEEREDADNDLNSLCFDLISKNKNNLAAVLFEFAISLPKHHNDTIKRMMIINLAQAYRWSGDKDKCDEVLSRFDWSALGYEFKLAVSVLKEENQKASELLKTVVSTGDISEREIVNWPLFKEYRKTDEFLSAFKELFGKDYAQQEELVREEFDTHMKSILNPSMSEGDDSIDEKAKVEEVVEQIEKGFKEDSGLDDSIDSMGEDIKVH